MKTSKIKPKKKVIKKKVLKKTNSSPRKKKVLKRIKKIARRPRSVGRKKKLRPLSLKRSLKNPIMSPAAESYWESEAVFNPGAVSHGGRVHLFYRALGPDGVSRIGYASSKDGVHFDKRHMHPILLPELHLRIDRHQPRTSPARTLKYDRTLYASGGGWGGCEDPRAVKIDGRVYITFNLFNGWNSICIGLTSISEEELEQERWNWRPLVYLSPLDQRHKNWVLFPEKIGGKFAVLHNLHDPDISKVKIEFTDEIEEPLPELRSPDPQGMPDRIIGWHNRMRSVGPPPIKTKLGWLAFYHAMDKNDPGRYKLGAMLLDLKDPTHVLYRSSYPVLEPDEWYENDWKPGIIYASGAVVMGKNLYIYYGGGDKHIGVAYTDLENFASKLKKNEHAVLTKEKIAIA